MLDFSSIVVVFHIFFYYFSIFRRFLSTRFPITAISYYHRGWCKKDKKSDWNIFFCRVCFSEKKLGLDAIICYFWPQNRIPRQQLRMYSNSEVCRSKSRSKYLKHYFQTTFLRLVSLGYKASTIMLNNNSRAFCIEHFGANKLGSIAFKTASKRYRKVEET